MCIRDRHNTMIYFIIMIMYKTKYVTDFNKANLISVSYTHLDVYKRQH